MKSNSVEQISYSWQKPLSFELISDEISFKNKIDFQKLGILCHFYVKGREERCLLGGDIAIYVEQFFGENF